MMHPYWLILELQQLSVLYLPLTPNRRVSLKIWSIFGIRGVLLRKRKGSRCFSPYEQTSLRLDIYFWRPSVCRLAIWYQALQRVLIVASASSACPRPVSACPQHDSACISSGVNLVLFLIGPWLITRPRKVDSNVHCRCPNIIRCSNRRRFGIEYGKIFSSN